MKALTIFLALFNIIHLTKSQNDQSLYDKKHDHHEWSYSGEYGPDHWMELDPSYSTCGGSEQSPIDIHKVECKEVNKKLEFHYHPFFVDLINNGHTLIEKIVEPKALKFDEKNYSLLQFHFHTPSEHHVDGKEYPMEIHFVHQSLDNTYAVLAVLVKEGKHKNAFLAHFMKTLPTHVNEELKSFEKADPLETFPKHFEKFYYYRGSLTTPPCTEGINWIVLEEPVEATTEQIEAIHKIIKDDNRPIQDSNHRTVYHAGS
ncbi:MAG: carbonic anhydrase family protein [Cyclobacteriaceae bacterium]